MLFYTRPAFFAQRCFTLPLDHTERKQTCQEFAVLPSSGSAFSARCRAHRASFCSAFNHLIGSGLSGRANFQALCEILSWPHSVCVADWCQMSRPTGRRICQRPFSSPLSLVSRCHSIHARGAEIRCWWRLGRARCEIQVLTFAATTRSGRAPENPHSM